MLEKRDYRYVVRCLFVFCLTPRARVKGQDILCTDSTFSEMQQHVGGVSTDLMFRAERSLYNNNTRAHARTQTHTHRHTRTHARSHARTLARTRARARTHTHTHTHSKHWFTTSFLPSFGGRCRKAMLGV